MFRTAHGAWRMAFAIVDASHALLLRAQDFSLTVRSRCALEGGRIDHDGLRLSARRGQSLHHPEGLAPLTSPLPTVVEDLFDKLRTGLCASKSLATSDERNPL